MPRVNSSPSRAHDGVSAEGDLKRRLVGFVADAPALDGGVGKSFGVEVSLVPECGDDRSTDRNTRARCRRAARVGLPGWRRAKRLPE